MPLVTVKKSKVEGGGLGDKYEEKRKERLGERE